ncbi:MAG: trigger factor [Candidatus Pacebacteria bacterium]|nr:trigger factor [Candidatus Paceibacterota bacterium]
MKIKITSLPKSKIEIIVNLDKKDLLPFKDIALKDLNKGLKINGYRVGKVPLSIAENHFSPLKIYEKAASLAIEKFYPQIIKEEKIQAIGYPSVNITKIIPNQEVEFKAEISIIPDLNLPDYKKIAKDMQTKKLNVTIEKKEIDDALLWLQNSRSVLEKVERPAEKKDIVTIDYQIKEKKNLIKNGEDKNYAFILGKGHFIPGFEENLIGMKAGKKKIFDITVPKSWIQKDLQGKKLSVEISLKEIKKKKLPPLNDKFAQELGKFKNLEELKKNILKGLKIEKETKEKERWRLSVLDEIITDTQVDLPEILIHTEIEKMMEELKSQLEKIQLTFEKYLEQIKKTGEELKKDFQGLAKKRVFSSLVLREIGLLEKIEVSEDEIKEKVNEILQQIPDPKIKEKINPEDLKEFALGIVRNEKVFQILEKQ